MAYSGRKLKYFVDDTDGWLRRNQAVAEQFYLAEDDNEVPELVSHFAPFAHFAGFWGVARGPHAAVAVRTQEREQLRVTWHTGATPVTSHTFVRDGRLHVVKGTYLCNIPLIGPWISSFYEAPVHEWLVVREGKVVYRGLDYDWHLTVH